MTMTDSERLIDALHARAGIVSVVGAGGKKTTLYHLLAVHPGRVGLSATSFTYHFPRNLPAEVHVAPLAELRQRIPASPARCIAYAQPSTKRGRLAGLEGPDILDLHRCAGFDVTLLKSDGARMRLIKCPAEHEPQIPDCATVVLPVLSVAAVGRPLDETVAHRPEQVARITGLRAGDPLKPQHLARIYAHPDGLLKGAGDRPVVPVLHMVDGPEEEANARETAERTLSACPDFEHVVLTSARRDGYLVDIVRR